MLEIKHRKTHAVLAQIDADSLEGQKMAGARLGGADLSGVNLHGSIW